MDAMKASQFGGIKKRGDGGMPLPETSNSSIVYFQNSMHIIEPVSNDEAGDIDDAGKHSLFTVNVSLGSAPVVTNVTRNFTFAEELMLCRLVRLSVDKFRPHQKVTTDFRQKKNYYICSGLSRDP